MSPLPQPRSRIAGLLGVWVTAALLLTGCATGAGPAPQQAASVLPAAEGQTVYPLTLESPYGETVLKERPERIAAIVPNAIDAELLLSLGITPVIASSMIHESASGSYLKPYGAESIETFEFPRGENLPIEAIAASEPDLIVAVGWPGGKGSLKLGDYYDRLSAIAPVLTSNDAEDRFLVPWQESIKILGETLDLRKAAQSQIDANDAYFAAFRADRPELGGLTATWAIWYNTEYGLQYLSLPDSAPETFLKGLGFSPNPLANTFRTESIVSDELLGKLDADLLLLGRSRVGDEAEFKKLTNGELFQSIGAVAAGRWVTVPPIIEDGGDLLWAVTSGGPIGTEWAAEQLLPLITKTP